MKTDVMYRYRVPASLELEALLSSLEERFRLIAEPPVPIVLRYFDSFNGLLFGAGMALRHEVREGRSELRLEPLSPGKPSGFLESDTAPLFASDLPDSSLRDVLAPLLGYRSLIPLVEVSFEKQLFRLIDKNQKTLAWLVVEKDAVAIDPVSQKEALLGTSLQLNPVKGYARSIREVVQFLEAFGLQPLVSPFMLTALEAIGSAPNHPPTYHQVAIEPTQRTDWVIQIILSNLLDVMVANEPGVRAGQDTEYLHDYRVAVRRTRSVLSQLKKAFPPDVLEKFAPELKWLGGMTGPTRDLDVYLLKFPNYQSWLPSEVQEDLIPLRVFLQERQRHEHQLLVDALARERYRLLVRSWRAWLDAPLPTKAATSMGSLPVIDVASSRIKKVYKQVVNEGNALVADARAPAEALHALRITCKKLRYLMEMFRDLYPPEDINESIGALKKLQDNLGDFNDFAVQQDKLQHFAHQMMEAGNVPADTFLAMGRLEEHLSMLQQKTREEFNQRFLAFAAPENQQHFKRLVR